LPDSDSSQENTTVGEKTLIIEKLMVLVLGVAVFGILVWQAPAIISFFESVDTSDSEYTQLSLVSGISQTYQHKNNTFVFSYKLSSTDSSNLVYVTQNAIEQSRSFPAVAGTTYSTLGLEIKISSVTQELLVLLIKPLPD
jgi:hypothetical protein